MECSNIFVSAEVFKIYPKASKRKFSNSPKKIANLILTETPERRKLKWNATEEREKKREIYKFPIKKLKMLTKDMSSDYDGEDAPFLIG